MRHVVKSGEVFHLWANQVQSDARSGNISYMGTSAYSYGQCIGEVVKNADGEAGYIINAHARRSNTTQTHVSALKCAIPSYKLDRTWIVPIGNAYNSESLRYLLNEIAELTAKAKRARSNKPYLLQQIPGMIEKAKAFAEFFNITDVIVPDTAEEVTELTAAMLDAENAKAAERAAKERVGYEKRYAAGKLQFESTNLPSWIAGTLQTHLYAGCDEYRPELACMRIATDGETVETTFGARVPLSEIRIVAPRILSIFDSGKTWINAHALSLGGYHVHSIENGILTVGCHKFTEAEVRRFAALIAE